MTRAGRWVGLCASWALAGALLTGCGAADPEIELSPLSARLAQIDQSLAAQRFEQARRDLTALAAAVKGARSDGELSATRSDEILDAIVALRASLPAPTPAASPTPTPTPTPTRPTGTTGGVEQPGEPKDAGPEKGKGKGKGRKP